MASTLGVGLFALTVLTVAASVPPVEEPKMQPVRIYIEPRTEKVDNPEVSDALLKDLPIQPTYEKSREEKAQYLRSSEIPKMVDTGFFQTELCKKWHNCTRPAPVDEHARPQKVSPGHISMVHREELEARMQSALLMRWDTVEANALSDLEAQRQVCKIIAGLQPIADLVVQSGSDEDIEEATGIFAVVCPRVKSTFPKATARLDCKDLHSKTVAYSNAAERDASTVFDIGSCCNCSQTEKHYQHAKADLDRQNKELINAVKESRHRLATSPPVVAEPQIVGSLSSIGARFVEPEDAEAAPGNDLRMKAVSEKASRHSMHRSHQRRFRLSAGAQQHRSTMISPEIVHTLQRSTHESGEIQTILPVGRNVQHRTDPAPEAAPESLSHSAHPPQARETSYDDDALDNFDDEAEVASQMSRLDKELAEETASLNALKSVAHH
jgi:hypothetical protein